MEPHGKLVRDRIPKLISASGGSPSIRTLGPSERIPALLAKLGEESDELRDAVTPSDQTEELADLLEVLLALSSELDLAWPDIEAAAAQKRAERGSFSEGIWLNLG